MKPVGYWPFDVKNGMYDLSEIVSDWLINDENVVYAKGPNGRSDTALSFNGM